MRKYIRVLLVIVLLNVFLYSLSFKPIKKAVQTSELQEKDYIMVKALQSTAATWSIVADNYGLYEMPMEVTLTGMYPSVIYDVQTGGNVFICYGEYGEDIFTTAGYWNKNFRVEEWDILYPIKHNSIFSLFLSDKYLYPFEIEG